MPVIDISSRHDATTRRQESAPTFTVTTLSMV